MKRIFTYIAMLALAVGCTDLYGPQEPSLTPDKSSVGSVEITLSEVTDNSFKVTVTPTGNVSYYSYLVDAATAAAELDAEKLYKVGYTSLAQGTVKYTTEAPSYSFTVEAKPNTTYQVYAVAASAMGFPGAVVSKSITTTDTVAPAYVSVDSDENQVMFTFSENVARNAEGGSIKVTYYAYYSGAFQNQAAPAGEITVPEEAIQVAGNKTLITVPGLPTGALWTIEIPEGAYVDAVGQPIPGYKSTFVMTEDGPAPKGFYGEVTYVELPMLGDFELESFSDWENPFVIPMENEYQIANYSKSKFIKVTYESETSTTTQTITHTLAPGVDYAVTSLGLIVVLPEQPAFGADVTISVPAGAIYDIYGNDCEAWEATLLHSYGYSMEDVLGTFSGVAISYWDGPVALSFTVAESDNEDYGNVMLTGKYMGLPCTDGNIYADFNPDSGVLRIYSGQLFLNHPTAGKVIFAVNGVEYTDLHMKEKGVLSAPSDWFGAYLYDLGSWVDIYTDCELVLQTSEEETAANSVPALPMNLVGRTL